MSEEDRLELEVLREEVQELKENNIILIKFIIGLIDTYTDQQLEDMQYALLGKEKT